MLPTSIQEFLARHWLIFGFIFIAFIWLPEWVSSVWSLYSSEPLFAAMSRKAGGMSFPNFSPYWITVPISILMFSYLVYAIRAKQIGVSVGIQEISKPEVDLIPSAGPSQDLRLAVINRGPEGKFWAKCKIITVRNDSQAKIGTFTLKWLDASDRERTIKRHDTENLLIARFHPIQAMEDASRVNHVRQMDIVEWSANGEKEFTSSRWIMPAMSLPEYDVEIMVFRESTQSPMIAHYTIRPKSSTGSLEMIVRPIQESLPAEYISMKEAASRLFQAVSPRFILQRARENLEAGHHVRNDLQIVAQYIASHIPIYGRRGLGHQIEPSALQQIQTNDIEASAFDEEATKLVHKFYSTEYFTHLSVRAEELEALIAEEQMGQGFQETNDRS